MNHLEFTGPEIRSLMRKHRVTIKELSRRMGITMKRIRQVRLIGIQNPNAARDWSEAIRQTSELPT